MRLSIIAALLTTAALTGGCQDNEAQSGAGVEASVSLELLADMVRNVAGERVDVEALLPPGADPHTFELAPGRVRDIAEADIVFLNGLGLEGSLEDVVANNAGGPVVELAEGLPVIETGKEAGDEGEDHEEEGSDEHGEGNPHLWLDAQLAARYVERIRGALIEIDPGGRETYSSNADAYLNELRVLDQEIESAIASIPQERRKLVTFHDAFPYLATRYGLDIIAVAVPSAGQEPSARDIADLSRALEDQNIPAAFAEPQFNSDVLNQAAGDAGVDVRTLLSDAYIDEVDSYVELMRFNMQQLVEGLGGG
jgi:zinc/manganese transport system substrate-binding protein/manganese/iron transport system substrate-binding protein